MRAERFPLGAAVTLDDLERNLHSTLRRLRETEPVSWVSVLAAWLITSRDIAITVMLEDEGFTVDDPRFSTAQIVGPSMLSTDGNKHARHREPFADPYRKRQVDEDLGAWVRDEARRLVGELQPLGTGELVTALAAPLAAAVIRQSLGLVDTDIEEMLRWYDAIVEAVEGITAGHADQPEGRGAYCRLEEAVIRTIRQAEASIPAQAARHSITEVEVASNAAVIMFGAIATSEAATASALYHLLTHPQQLAPVEADRSLVAAAVEESLRLEPAAASIDRYATRDTELSGVEIRKGDYVIVSIAGANRDPATFSEPDEFEPARANTRQHVTFAHGPHVCLGLHLARLEAVEAVDAALDLLPGLVIDETRSAPPTGLIFRKPPAVQAIWETDH